MCRFLTMWTKYYVSVDRILNKLIIKINNKNLIIKMSLKI